MNISELNSISDKLADYLKNRGIMNVPEVFGDVYTNGSVPTSGLPESFLEITGNGPLTSSVSQFGIEDYNIMLIVYVKLNSKGELNETREKYLLALIEDWLKGTLVLDKYHYTLNKRNMVYAGRNLVTGYSSKIMNINVKIY